MGYILSRPEPIVGTGLATNARYVGGTAGDAVPVLWTAGGFTAFTAPAMGGTGNATATVADRNAGGMVVGTQRRSVGDGTYTASQAVRWDSPGTPTVLAHGITGAAVGSYAAGINATGTAVRASFLFEKDTGGNFYVSTLYRPVRWAAGTSAATPLDVAAPGGRALEYRRHGAHRTRTRARLGERGCRGLGNARPAERRVIGTTPITVNGVTARRDPTRWSADGSVTWTCRPTRSRPAASTKPSTSTTVARSSAASRPKPAAPTDFAPSAGTRVRRP